MDVSVSKIENGFLVFTTPAAGGFGQPTKKIVVYCPDIDQVKSEVARVLAIDDEPQPKGGDK